jgi:hypothetical protein
MLDIKPVKWSQSVYNISFVRALAAFATGIDAAIDPAVVIEPFKKALREILEVIANIHIRY